MSAADKDVLAQHLKERNAFVVANGDGTNDIVMMRQAHLVLTHLDEEGNFSPGIEPFSNLSDQQVQALLGQKKSLYELLDIHEKKSAFFRRFTPLANTQENVSLALILKTCKISFELMKAFGFSDVTEMPMKHYSSIAFDIGFLGITFNRILASPNLPADNRHLNRSQLPRNLMLSTLAFSALTAQRRYAQTGEATNWETMAAWLAVLPFVQNTLFSAFKPVQQQT